MVWDFCEIWVNVFLCVTFYFLDIWTFAKKDLYLVRAQKLISLILHEIRWISLWNLVDFRHEIRQITVKSGRFHAWNSLNQIIQEKLFTFIECWGGGGGGEGYVIWNLKSGEFHLKFDGFWILWNPTVMKSKRILLNGTGFYEIHRTWQDFMKSTAFHRISLNSTDFTDIRRISL